MHYFIIKIYKFQHLDPPSISISLLHRLPDLNLRFKVVPSVEISKHLGLRRSICHVYDPVYDFFQYLFICIKLPPTFH